MTECVLRELWSAARAGPLLPSSPAAGLGTAIHRLLEEAGEGRLADPETAAHRWNELVAEAEERMKRSWLERRFVPLAASIPQFAVRRLQALQRVSELSQSRVRQPRDAALHEASHGFELPVATPDGTVKGRIDAAIKTSDGVIIQDYKSGAILDRATGDVSAHYAVQLRLYAALYAIVTGSWPWRLELVPLSGDPREVPFDKEECHALLQSAVALLANVRSAMDSEAGTTQAALASPAPATCARCSFRPWCRPYRQTAVATPELEWPADVWGRLDDVRLLGNGTQLALIAASRGAVRIKGLSADPERHPALAIAKNGDSVSAFGLRSTASPLAFEQTDFTVFFVERPSSLDADHD